MTSFRAHRLLLVYLLRTQRWHERFLKNRNSLTNQKMEREKNWNDISGNNWHEMKEKRKKERDRMKEREREKMFSCKRISVWRKAVGVFISVTQMRWLG